MRRPGDHYFLQLSLIHNYSCPVVAVRYCTSCLKTKVKWYCDSHSHHTKHWTDTKIEDTKRYEDFYDGDGNPLMEEIEMSASSSDKIDRSSLELMPPSANVTSAAWRYCKRYKGSQSDPSLQSLKNVAVCIFCHHTYNKSKEEGGLIKNGGVGKQIWDILGSQSAGHVSRHFKLTSCPGNKKPDVLNAIFADQKVDFLQGS